MRGEVRRQRTQTAGRGRTGVLVRGFWPLWVREESPLKRWAGRVLGEA